MAEKLQVIENEVVTPPQGEPQPEQRRRPGRPLGSKNRHPRQSQTPTRSREYSTPHQSRSSVQAHYQPVPWLNRNSNKVRWGIQININNTWYNMAEGRKPLLFRSQDNAMEWISKQTF